MVKLLLLIPQRQELSSLLCVVQKIAYIVHLCTYGNFYDVVFSRTKWKT